MEAPGVLPTSCAVSQAAWKGGRAAVLLFECSEQPQAGVNLN